MEGIGGRGRKRENEIIIMLKIKIKNGTFLLIHYISCCSHQKKKKIPGKSNLWSQGFALAHNWIVRSIKGIIAAL